MEKRAEYAIIRADTNDKISQIFTSKEEAEKIRRKRSDADKYKVVSREVTITYG